MTEFWIEKSCGFSIDNAEITDALNAVDEITKMYEKDTSFWIGHIEEEYVLRFHKDLSLRYIYGANQDQELMILFEDWSSAEHFVRMYFSKDFLGIKEAMKRILSNKTTKLT